MRGTHTAIGGAFTVENISPYRVTLSAPASPPFLPVRKRLGVYIFSSGARHNAICRHGDFRHDDHNYLRASFLFNLLPVSGETRGEGNGPDRETDGAAERNGRRACLKCRARAR